MKITQIQHIETSFPQTVMDCVIDRGYQKAGHGSLPDIDLDFDAERRQEVKQHLEARYNRNGKQRVFSAGTFNTLGLKSVVTDVSRNHRIPVSTVKYMTAIFQMDDVTWTDAMRAAFKSKTLYNFVQKYPHVFEEMMPIMNQPRSGGMHASAIIITPDYVKGEDVNCYEVLPVRYMDGQLASEISGYDVDEIGLLKNDCLGIAELSRISQMFELCKQEFGVELDMLDITRNKTDDPDVFRMISRGATQGVFQMSGDGITRFIKQMRPDNINDIIASVALFRPGPLRSGAAMGYIEAKHGVVEPVYLWGTYEILKDTYGFMCIAHGTMVKTNKGLVEIQNINKGDMVQTEDGTYQKVLKTMYKTRKSVVRLRTSFGMELVCTPDHKVLTQRGWMEVQDLRPKRDFIKSYWLTDKHLPLGTLRDWCVGLYLANGFWGTTPCITCRSREDADKIAVLFDKAFGLHCNIYFQTRAWYVCCTYNTCGQRLQNPFKEYLKEVGLENCMCYDKSLDQWTLMTLTGFFEGDGCIFNHRIRIKNPRLAMQIFMAAQSARIPSSYYEDIENEDVVYTIVLTEIEKLPLQIKQRRNLSRCGGRMVPTTLIKDINVTSLPTKALRTLWYNTIKRDACRLHTVEMLGIHTDDCWGAVLSIKDDGYEKTYDLEVDKNHSFVASGLVVHNCYQEQISQTAQKIGSLSLGDGVNLVKALSKKKLEKVRKFKEKYFQGADANGCPRDAAEKIWSAVEDAAKYSFNKSHATAYGLTSYVGAWLKTHYPVVFYTVMLKWQDEDKLPLLLREIRELEGVRIERPNINISQQDFVTDYQSNVIYWSLCRIKQCGLKAGDYIVRERGFFGDYTSLDNFIDRIFKYKYGKSEWFIDGDNPKERNPVTSRIVRQLIISGAFDECEHIGSPEQRYELMKRAAERLGFQITDKMLDESQIGRFFYWEALQIKESSFGEINFGRIFSEYADGAALKKDYIKFQELDEEFRNFEKGGVICAQIESAEEKSFKDSKTGERKKYGKLTLRQNIDRATVTLWNDAWNSHKENLLHNNGRIIIAVVQVKYSEYEGRHAFQINKSAYVRVI